MLHSVRYRFLKPFEREANASRSCVAMFGTLEFKFCLVELSPCLGARRKWLGLFIACMLSNVLMLSHRMTGNVVTYGLECH